MIKSQQERANGIRVLVLDDEEPIRILLDTILTDAGCRVETAQDGRAGLQTLLYRDFDVVIVDLKMATMGGSEFLAEARSIWPWLGMIIVSGFVTDEAAAHARSHGVTRILPKPIRTSTLIEEVLAEARAKRERVELSASRSLDRIQEQLAMLRACSEAAMEATSLDEAIQCVTTGLGQLLPCAAIGILNTEADQTRLFLHAFQTLHPDFPPAMERNVIQRYQALTGLSRHPAHVIVPVGDLQTDERGCRVLRESFTVPILNDRNLRGLLTVAFAESSGPAQSDSPFLYHAANHLATVLSALHRMRELSVRDPLTGVYNRRGLEEEFGRAWQMARRYGQSIGLAVIDIDHFKGLNDQHGHPAGDEVLREFSTLIRSVARGTDIVGRLGGDELMVVLPQSGPGDALAFGERLCAAARRTIFNEPNRALSLTASVGVAARTAPAEEDLPDGLIAMADRALYAAKRAGRDRVSIFQPAMITDSAEEEATGAAPAVERSTDRRARGHILVVDDEPAIRQVVARILEARGYRVETCTSAEEAIERLEKGTGHFEVLLTDLSMPGMGGFELLDRLRTVAPDLVKVVITGHATLDNALESLRRGAYDFIEKPIRPDHLNAVIDRAAEHSRLKAENRRYQDHLEELVREKSAALRAALEEIRRSYDFTLEAMVGMLDARERSTGQHSLRVRRLAVVLGRALGLSAAELDELAHGALLHDIGKIAVPDSVLLKPGPLSDDERAVMREHPVTGHRLLAGSPYLERASAIVLQHQETWDGSGYPAGLKGEAICMGARIFAVVDTYDALRSDRVYRKGVTPPAAAEEIKRHAGTQFDPRVVEAFTRCQPELERAGGWIG